MRCIFFRLTCTKLALIFRFYPFPVLAWSSLLPGLISVLQCKQYCLLNTLEIPFLYSNNYPALKLFSAQCVLKQDPSGYSVFYTKNGCQQCKQRQVWWSLPLYVPDFAMVSFPEILRLVLGGATLQAPLIPTMHLLLREGAVHLDARVFKCQGAPFCSSASWRPQPKQRALPKLHNLLP